MFYPKMSFLAIMLLALNSLPAEDLRLATKDEEDRKWKIKVGIGRMAKDPGQAALLGDLQSGPKKISGLILNKSGAEYVSEDWVCLSPEANNLAKVKTATGEVLHLIQGRDLKTMIELTLRTPTGEIVFQLGTMPVAIEGPLKLAGMITATPDLSVVVKRNRLDLPVGNTAKLKAAIIAQSQSIIDNLKWSITPLGDIEATWPADKPDGSARDISNVAKWGAADLPESSSQYAGLAPNGDARGGLTVTLKALNNANLTIRPSEVSWYAFFDPLRKDHKIDGKPVPNWFYYWRKENPDAISQFSGNPDDPIFIEPVDSYTDEDERSRGALGAAHVKHFARQGRQPRVEIKGANIMNQVLPMKFKFPANGTETSIPTLAIRSCSWSIGTRTDLLNVTACHEATHRMLYKTIVAKFGGDPTADGNQDGIPDTWALSLGLQSGQVPIKIPKAEFDGSDGGTVEFIAWIGAAFNPDFGIINTKPEFTKKKYETMGIIPRSTKSSLDWSKGGANYSSINEALRKEL